MIKSEDLTWQLYLDYDLKQSTFVLFINGIVFLDLPYQAEAKPSGP